MDHLTVRGQHRHRNLEQMICHACSSPRFAQRLIAAPASVFGDPAYQHLSSSERALVASIRATDIHDFAAQLHAKLSQLEEHVIHMANSSVFA